MKKYKQNFWIEKFQKKLDERFGKGIFKAAVILFLFGSLSLVSCQPETTSVQNTQTETPTQTRTNNRVPPNVITINDTGQTATLNERPTSPDSPDSELERITDVYFAKKVVNNNQVTFTRIDSTHIQNDAQGQPIAYDSILGKTVYLILEAENLEGEQLDVVIRSSLVQMNEENDTMQLMFFNETNRTMQASRIKRTRVGNTDALLPRVGDCPYTNLDTYRNQAIIKLQLRPQTRARFNEWAQAIGNGTANLEVLVERFPNANCAYGEGEEEVNTAGVFLNDETARFRVTNRNFYEIYHGENPYNFLPMNGQNRRRIAKLESYYRNDQDTRIDITNLVTYFYYDQNDNEHSVCERELAQVRMKRRVGSVPPISSRGRLIKTISYTTNQQAGELIDASELRFYENGTLGFGNPDRWYENNGQGIVKLINMDILENDGVGSQIFEAFNYNQNGVRIRYGFQHSRRRSIHPDLFAGFLGALAQFRQQGYNHYIVSQGFSYEDGSCYPSAEHVNGQAGDLNLLTYVGDGFNTRLSRANFDYDSQLVLRNILFDFGFQSGRSENFSNTQNQSTADNQSTRLPNTIHTTNPRHDNHLHLHNFINKPDLYA
jgi:hypothetical protein